MNHKELFDIYNLCNDRVEVFKHLCFFEKHYYDSVMFYFVTPHTFYKDRIVCSLVRVGTQNLENIKNNFTLFESEIYDREYFFCINEEHCIQLKEKLELLG